MSGKQIATKSANICLFKVNNRNTRKRCKICSNLPKKWPEQCNWRYSDVFIFNFDHRPTDPLTTYHSTNDLPTGYHKLTLKQRPDSKHILYSKVLENFRYHLFSEQTNNTLMQLCIRIWLPLGVWKVIVRIGLIIIM